MDADLVIRQMTRSEVTRLIDWAAAEGWNPGLHDGEVFRHTDPHAFIAAIAVGGPLFLDVPENNPAAIALAQHYEMREVFGCARM